MSLTCLYFVAPTDRDAAAIVDYVTGPANWPRDAAVRDRRGRHTPRNTAPDAQPSYATVDGRGVDPVVDLSRLEAVLTGDSFNAAMDRNARGDSVAFRDEGARIVKRLSARWTAAIAALPPSAIADVAKRWANDEHVGHWAEPSDLADLVSELRKLARESIDTGGAVYCWVDA